MRIAVSIWEDKVSPVLDTASKLLIIESEMQKEVSRFETHLFVQDISRRCHFVCGLNIDVLICGAVSCKLSGRLMSSGIEVISGISGSAEEVLEAYLQGALLHPRFLMPGWKSNNM
jgi:predicted Fe-Mo cluster-binding NifX family protein